MFEASTCFSKIMEEVNSVWCKIAKSQMIAQFTELRIIIQISHYFCQIHASRSQVFTKRTGENEIVFGFTMSVTKRYLPNAPVNLLD